MAAPQGNQFWKARSKHGRDRIIKDSHCLAESIDEYFQWCVDNPILETDFRGRDLVEVLIPHPRAFKKEELARFCGLSEWRLITDLKKISDDFSQVITRAEKIIADQKYTYAVVGMFNATIVARDLGLADKKEVEQKNVSLTDEEREEKIKELTKRAKE